MHRCVWCLLVPSWDSSRTLAGAIKDKDTLLFFNFRSDRMRQIITAFQYKSDIPTNEQSSLSVSVSLF